MGREVRIFDIEPSDDVPEGAEFFKGDMRDSEAVSRSMKGIDTVYHLAFVQVMSKRPEPEKWAVNYGGTENFLKASVDEGVKRFVFTSTAELYNAFPPNPITEDCRTDKPCGWYGRHKKACEELCFRYYWEHELPVTMCRMPTICGRGYYARIDLLRVFDWMLSNRPFLWVGGRQFEGDWLWIEDCVDAYVLLGTKDGAVGEAFNISCSESCTSLELVRTLMDVADNTHEIRLVPPWLIWPLLKLATKIKVLDMPAEHLQYLMGDYHFSIEKARSLLGYDPKMNAAQAATELLLGYIEDRDTVKFKAKHY